jgi:O-antigen ligase
LVLFGLVLALGVRMAGEGVRERFMTLFASKEERDGSLNSRSLLFSYGVDSIQKRPFLGVGSQHWSKVARSEYGIPPGRATEMHNTWAQFAAELGLPALVLILTSYALCIGRLWPIAWQEDDESGPGFGDLSRAVISSLCGSVVSSAFVTAHRVEPPYYILLIGAGLLKVLSGGIEHDDASDAALKPGGPGLAGESAADRGFPAPRSSGWRQPAS